MSAPSGDDDALDRRFADIAVGVGASVDAVLQLEESLLAAGVHVIGDGGSAEGDGFLEDGLDSGMKALQFVAGELTGATAGTDTRAVERFVGVDVAHSVQ